MANRNNFDRDHQFSNHPKLNRERGNRREFGRDLNRDTNQEMNSRGFERNSYGGSDYFSDNDTLGRSYDEGRIQFDNSPNRSFDTDRQSIPSYENDNSRKLRSSSADFNRTPSYGSQTYGSTERWSGNYGEGRDYQSRPRFSERGYDEAPHHEETTWEKIKSFVGIGPKGYKRSDERIREDVCETLERHPRIDASEIEVEVKENLVTLRGIVDSRDIKRLAEDTVLHCSGVKDVRNELQIASHFKNEETDSLRSSTTSPSASLGAGAKSKNIQ